MRKALGLVFPGCLLVVGLACSDGATTPTEPAVTATSTSNVQSVTAASAQKICICHGNKSEPFGVVVEVSDEYYKRHLKHLNYGYDCPCLSASISGEECSVTNGSGVYWQRGPLVFALPIASEWKPTRGYPIAGFADRDYTPKARSFWDYAVDATCGNFFFERTPAGDGADPWEKSPCALRGMLRNRKSNQAETPLVTTYEQGQWILWQAHPKQYIFTAFLEEYNPQIQEWAYFNYLIYSLVERAAGQLPQSFAEYHASPVPHATVRNALFALLALIVVTSFGAFFFVRRYSLQHPEALDQIVSDRKRFEVREEGTNWEQVAGFHRPLSGFLVALSTGVLLFIPLIIYQNLILPSYILPSAQALGTWGRVTQFFNLAWFFFDMATSVALVKYMSQYRVDKGPGAASSLGRYLSGGNGFPGRCRWRWVWRWPQQ